MDHLSRSDGLSLQTGYCSILQGILLTDKLQRVLNASARVISSTRECDRGLHWLDVPRRVSFKLCVNIYKRHGPRYLTDLCSAGLFLKSKDVAISALQHVACSTSLAMNCQPTEIALFPRLVQLPGIPSQNVCRHLIPLSAVTSAKTNLYAQLTHLAH